MFTSLRASCMRIALLPATMKIGQAFDDLPEGSLAGEEGFEPSNAGIKIRCLDQLGDSPAGRSNGFAFKRGANNTGDDSGNPAFYSTFASGCSGRPSATQPHKPGGNPAKAASASLR